MADTKISALPASTLPLAGTEVLPIVQSGATKKVATDDLTVKNVRSNATNGILQIAGPAAAATRVMTTPDANFTAARIDAAQSFTGDQTLSTGNLVIGTAGKGIDFSADPSAAGMTSELLDDYEEGTFTPTIDFGGGTTGITYSQQVGIYTKTGRNVSFSIWIVLSSKGSSTGVLSINALPFTSNANVSTSIFADSFGATVNTLVMYLGASGTTIFPYKLAVGAITRLTDADLTNTSNMMIAGNYSV
jgi:hypothetical protein